jgi:hypothetical protein
VKEGFIGNFETRRVVSSLSVMTEEERALKDFAIKYIGSLDKRYVRKI